MFDQSHTWTDLYVDFTMINGIPGSCLTIPFYFTARAGEFTIPNLSSFKPTIHVKRSDVHLESDRNGLAPTVFHLPRTK
ncbi:hypothetical protein K503DRAFT_821835 [Rhizopogon vinicolor AM-OR11-026]|uniref:Uncharacterized protein n=1 Tax=Rhizopogon vinicolor AM-OR11-026 TaxID=1314800 RepID=A0A1B7NE06_9AGAM|nr:hypothetical protein K503DRAFT_821835 [Rhizopogon vinicolor AM-OR11-026]